MEIQQKAVEHNLGAFGCLLAIAFAIVVVVSLVVMTMLHTHSIDSWFPRPLLVVPVFTCNYCLYSTPKFRWLACGVVCLMMGAYGLILTALGLPFVEAVMEYFVVSPLMIGMIWLCTFILRWKAGRLVGMWSAE